MQSGTEQEQSAKTGQSFRAGCAAAQRESLDSVILVEIERSYEVIQILLPAKKKTAPCSALLSALPNSVRVFQMMGLLPLPFRAYFSAEFISNPGTFFTLQCLA